MRAVVLRAACMPAMALLFAVAWPLRADWTGFGDYAAVAEVSVEEDAVRVNLRLRESGLPRLRALLGRADDAPASDLAGGLLRIVADRQGAAEFEILKLETNTSGKDGTGVAEAYFEADLNLPLARRPTGLTLSPPDRAAKALGLVVLHRGVPVADLAPLSKPARLQLDWNDPWQSRFADAERVRRHTEPRSFVYVEPYEVRHELLLRLSDLLPRLEIAPVNPHRIEGEEREKLRQAIGTLLLRRNPLRLDGVEVTARLDRIEFVRYRRSGVETIADSEPLDSATAVVGAILVYLTERPAGAVELTWEWFDAAGTGRAVSLQRDNETFDADVTQRDPVFRWSVEEALDTPGPEDSNPSSETFAARPSGTADLPLRAAGIALAMAVGWRWRRRRLLPPGTGGQLILTLAIAGCVAFYPEIAGLCADAGRTTPASAEDPVKSELEALLHNVYRAFQMPEEESAYDRLAISLSGEVLDEVYLSQRAALLQRRKGLGSDGRVERVQVLTTEIESLDQESGRCVVNARWIAHGSISHWGHSHPRSTLYAARLVLSRAEDGRLRIAALAFADARKPQSVALSS
ncbi:hypothetical protein [Methylocaldum marinum]|nr:hypothetical protein [Methylocaldum marinum]